MVNNFNNNNNINNNNNNINKIIIIETKGMDPVHLVITDVAVWQRTDYH